jgi:hypothetical protein
MTLADDFEAGGVWIANGSGVTLGSHTLRVDGTLATRWGASLVMDSDADSLIVAGSIEFGGGNQNVAFGGERFSAGVFELQGNLLDQFHHFRSSGTNKVRLSGTSAQTIRSYCAGLGACEVQDTTYQDVEVVNPAGVTFVDSPVRIMGDLTVLTGAAATFDNVTAVEGALDLPGTLTLNANKTLSVTGALLLRATGVLNNNGTMTVGSCTQEAGSTVNGTNPCP